jgi:hypothetical protein
MTNENRYPHDSSLKVGRIGWQNGNDQTYLQFQLASGAPGIDLSRMQSLDFDISRAEDARNAANVPTDFEIRLIDTLGRTSAPVNLGDFFRLVGPAGNSTGPLPVVASVRLPLNKFSGVDLTHILSVKWVFNRTPQGLIYAANLRASDNLAPTVLTPPLLLSGFDQNFGIKRVGPQTATTKQARLLSVRPGPSTQFHGADMATPASVVEIYRDEGFPITSELPSLRIDDQDYFSGGFSEDGDTRRMIFRVPSSIAQRITSGAPSKVRFGPSPEKEVSVVP